LNLRLYCYCFSTLCRIYHSEGPGEIGWKLDGTHCLVYTNNDNLLDKNICIGRKNTEALLVASYEVGLELNAENTKYMFMF
jgi:hypothetical protein